MNITIQGVNITLTPEQLQQIDIEVKKLNESAKPTPEQRFLELVQGLTLKTDFNNYPDRIFLIKDDEYWFEYNIKSRILYCRYVYVWKIFWDEYGMRNGDIKGFIKGLVEKHFKIRGITPAMVYGEARV